MPFKSYQPYIIVTALMVVTAFLVARSGKISAANEVPVKMDLPEAIQEWKGEDIFYCQRELCGKSFLKHQLSDVLVCPACGGELDTLSLGEKKLLPSDTIIAKKRYENSRDESVLVTIVVSGYEQKSIHRPQQCLRGQGYVIENSRAIRIPIDSSEDLRMMGLDIRSASRPGKQSTHAAFFTYCFLSRNRETPYHLQRLYWMSVDRIFSNIAQRWAYIAVATDRREGSDEHIKRISDFIAAMYPLIKK